jgi:hypothetical protein
MTQNFADADASSAIQDIELVFGLVGPTGVDLTAVCDALESKLSEVSYATEIVSLSQLIAVFLKTKIRNNNEYERIKDLMTLGTKLREETKQVESHKLDPFARKKHKIHYSPYLESPTLFVRSNALKRSSYSERSTAKHLRYFPSMRHGYHALSVSNANSPHPLKPANARNSLLSK